MDPEFSFTRRAAPFVEIGLGDSRIPSATGGRWNVNSWSDGTSQPGSFWSGKDPSWLDVTCEIHQWESFIGRHRLTDRFEPGTLTLTAKNESGWADLEPEHLTELPLRPGRQVRVGVWHAELGRIVLWRGFVDSVVPGYDPVLEDIVTIEAIDALGEVGRSKLPKLATPVGGGEVGSARVTRILNAALWPADARNIVATGVAMQASDLSGQVADLLGQVAESEGGAVFGDLEGRVAYRGRDWQVYDTGTPPDDVVGNVIPEDRDAIPAHLLPTIGTVSTPDPGPMPNTFTMTMRIQGPNAPYGTIASQWGVDGNRSWYLTRCGNHHEFDKQGCFDFYATPTGLLADETERDITQLPVADDFEYLAFTMTQNDPGDTAVTYGLGTYGSYTYGQASADDPLCKIIAWRSSDGVNWYVHKINSLTPAISIFDGTAPLVIGGGAEDVFNGRIQWVECRNSETPVTGSLLWRFDAADVPFGASTFTDPRGRTWTLTDPECVMPYQGPQIADVCPTSMELTFRRSDLVTQVTLGVEGDDTPTVFTDADWDEAQALYGIEPYETLDLICTTVGQLTILANRLKRTRTHTTKPQYQTMPRIESIGFTAARGDRVVDLLCKANPYTPTRLLTRLARQRGVVYNRQNFVTGIEMFVSRDEWTARMTLDIAAPWAVPQAAAQWSVDKWNKANWAAAV